MKSNFSAKSKIRKKVAKFVVKEYSASGRVPSIREISKKCKIKFYLYFSGAEDLYKLCNFDFTPEENKRRSIGSAIKEKYMPFRNIDDGRKQILSYFKNSVKRGNLTTRSEIQKQFHTSLKKYFPGGMKEVYELTNFDLPYRFRDRDDIARRILEYVRSEVKRGYYPTYMELDEKFHTNIRDLFSGIREVYFLAGVKYKRDPNPFMKYEKEEKLVNICIALFKKQEYKIEKVSIGPSRACGPDIILKDSSDRLIPVEVKAYHRFGKIGTDKDGKHSYLRNEFKQVRGYIEKLGSSYGFLVTSTNINVAKKIPENINLLLERDLRRMLVKEGMEKELEILDWIKNTHTSYDKKEIVKSMQKRILNYVEAELKKEGYVGRRELCKKFKIGLYAYFPNMKAIYQRLGVDPYSLPTHRMGGKSDNRILRERILNFVDVEVKMGNYPTYKEIQRRFHCLPKLYFPGGIREIYNLVGVPYNRKFANKTPKEKVEIRKEVIKYVRKESKKEHYPRYDEIKNNFEIGIENYFKGGIREIYDLAGVDLPSRQGLAEG